ncbi:MAG: hypothetical protein R2761_25035 [Acidimicrobiales bacterium]
MATTRTVLVPMGTPDGLVVALFHRGPKPDDMKLVATVNGHDQTIPVTEWRNCHAPFEGKEGADFELWAAKEKPNVRAATEVSLKVVGAETVTGSAWAAPGPDTRRCTLAFGSCFGLRNVRHLDDEAFDETIRRHMVEAYGELTAGSGDPVYNLWLGDQVYLDDPRVGSLASIRIHQRILDRYAQTWGLGGRSGFAHLLGRSANWFLTDDHELWNGYPRANITLLGHTAGRLKEQARRYVTHKAEPSHPFHQGDWGRMAGAAFMTFQSPSFDDDLNRFNDRVSPFPDADGPSPYAGVATFGSDTFTVALLDTRWNRTMLRSSHGKRHAGFSSEAALIEVETLLRERDHLVVLCLSRPIVGQPRKRIVVPFFAETAPEHYREQYERLLEAVETRSRAGWPTLILAGDVHAHSARLALGGSVLEIVSSPMSLIESLDTRGLLKIPWKKRLVKGGADLLGWLGDRIALPERSWASGRGENVLMLSEDDARRDGLAAVRIDTTNSAQPEVTYTCRLSGLAAKTATLQWRDQAWRI